VIAWNNIFRMSGATLILSIGLFLLPGCGQSSSAEFDAVRNRLLLDQEPENAVTIEQARQSAAETDEVTLIVKVGNRNFTTWHDTEHAAMFVSEGFPGSDYNVGPGHDSSTCPFCKWKWKEVDSMAILQITDESKNVLPISCDQIFDFQEGDEIVITGKPLLDVEAETLRVALTGLYPRTAH